MRECHLKVSPRVRRCKKKNNNFLICADSAHTTGWDFSHIEKCGETTDLTPLQQPASHSGFSCFQRKVWQSRCISCWGFIPEIIKERFWRLVISCLYTYSMQGETLPVDHSCTLSLRSAKPPELRCCYVDTSCWWKRGSAQAISLRISSGIYASRSPELQQILLQAAPLSSTRSEKK